VFSSFWTVSLRTPVNKGKKVEGSSTTDFVQTTYIGIGSGLMPCYGVAWEPGLSICFLVPSKGRGEEPRPQMGA